MTVFPFTSAFINQAPLANGVYFLLDGAELIYIGSASETGTIRGRLQSHAAGREGPCTQCATHFGCQVTQYPLSTEAELLREFERQHGRLPRCNDRIG